jgi:membrane protein YdbS with pleckstrin-like domain
MSIEPVVRTSTAATARGDEPLRADRIAIPGTAPRIEEEPRPHRNLLIYYALGSLLLGPFFWALLIPRYFRYHTLRYRFDDEGVTMRWGILFRKEISLTYARIQDIHLVSNVVERWLGLARIQIQTASGNAGAEMVIEGLQHFDQIRDFLYLRMRGAREQGHGSAATTLPARSAAAASLDPAALDELTQTLQMVAEEVRALRSALEPNHPAEEEVPHA